MWLAERNFSPNKLMKPERLAEYHKTLSSHAGGIWAWDYQYKTYVIITCLTWSHGSQLLSTTLVQSRWTKTKILEGDSSLSTVKRSKFLKLKSLVPASFPFQLVLEWEYYFHVVKNLVIRNVIRLSQTKTADTAHMRNFETLTGSLSLIFQAGWGTRLTFLGKRLTLYANTLTTHTRKVKCELVVARNQTQGSWLELPLNYDNNHQSSQKHKTLYTYCIVSHKVSDWALQHMCARTS